MSSEMESKYVIFKLDEEYYGIAIDNVLSIEKVEKVTRVPNAPKYVKGVINLRGEVIPLINLRMRLDIELKEHDKNSRIIVVSMDDIVAGLIVDSSSEVIEIDRENIDPPPRTEGNESTEFISGIGKTLDRLIILLDLVKVLEY
ncbi:MAG: chemotaxis protein CheW [Tissierellia bacterium]|nr:chemotaxis protein CheW [Tissierellia bacterium]